ncbi:IclR family transcriptional regulator [Streptomyces chartreusis]
MGGPGLEKQTLLHTLERGLKILEAVAASNGAATAKSLSTALNIKIGTCYHLLRTLVAHDYVIRQPNGCYDIGYRATVLSRRHIQEAPPPGPPAELISLLKRLHVGTRETSYLLGWSNDQLLVQCILGKRATNLSDLDVGYAEDLHARASSKSVLAFLAPEQVSAIVPRTHLRPLTPNTITEHGELLAELARVRRRGYALDLEEFRLGTACVSAAFFDRTGLPCGSFSLVVPRARFGARKAELVRHVQSVAAMASNLLRAGTVTVQRLSI